MAQTFYHTLSSLATQGRPSLRVRPTCTAQYPTLLAHLEANLSPTEHERHTALHKACTVDKLMSIPTMDQQLMAKATQLRCPAVEAHPVDIC